MFSRLALPEYKPDQSNNSGVLLVANNVFPAMDGYRAVNDVVAVSDALDESFQGGSSAIASDGDAFLLAGTASDLYVLNNDQSWTSLVSGLSVAGRWKFTQFGDFTIAVNGSSTYAVDLDAGTAAVVSGAPSFTDIAVIGGDYLVGARPNGDVSKVRWAAFGDYTSWTLGQNQAGEQPQRRGGAVMGIAGGEYGIILQRERLVRMTRTGSAASPFQFDEISANYGCAASNTIAQAGRTVFFRSDRGFMALDDGQSLRRIGSEKVDRFFEQEVPREDLENIYTAVDPQNNLVFWFVPGAPGTAWVYNFELDRWSTIELSAKGVFPGFTTSVGLDDLPSLGYTDLDAMTISLDDPFWSGGNPRFYFVTNADRVGNLTGDTLAAQLDPGFTELTPGHRARLRGIRPIWDGTTGMTVVTNAKLRLGDTADNTTANTLRSTGMIPVRTTGRYISTSIRIAAGTNWNYIQGLEYEFEQGGRR